MKKYYINDIEVHEKTYEQYLEKEFKRLKLACRQFDSHTYHCHSKIILNGIKFDVVDDTEVERA